MKRLTASLACLSLILVAASPALAAKMKRKEKKNLIEHLDRTRQMFLESVEGLSEEQWNFRAGEDRWSIAECAEHIVVSEEFIRKSIAEALAGEPAGPEQLEGAVKDDTVLQLVVDRSQKFQAPKPIQPTARWKDTGDIVKAFEGHRGRTVALVKRGKDLRRFVAPHPAFEQLDAYGWFLFLSAHTERHTLQILEVKEAEGFPKG
ncbi:MAG: DinB family protein [Deltaproteobacteria bacterium]|nr:DinB family protein [Deltaproteobacteria bacterium]